MRRSSDAHNNADVDEVRSAIVKKYRQEFFILDDVLHAVHGQLDEDKLMILAFLLPADRVERLLHFVGIDPVKWKQTWRETYSDAELRQREEEAIMKFGR